MSGYICRLMQQAELDEVIELAHKAGNFSWSPKIIQETFLSNINNSFVLGTIKESEVLGYAVIHKVLDESHLLNIVIKKQEQGKGLGTHFLQQLIDVVKQSNQDSLLLEVRSSNVKAIKLYEKFGFKRSDIRKAYYPTVEGREDAWLYSLSLE